MKIHRCLATFILITGILFVGLQGVTAQQADIVLKDGAVYTVDAVRSWAQAVAIDDGKIVYVGSTNGAEKFVGPKTQLVDLNGKMVLPGFQDIHIHPVDAGIEYNSCNLFDLSLTNAEKILAVVETCVKDNPTSPWITGGGWLLPAFPNGIPHKDLLDAVDNDRPIALKSADGHSLWTNSKAMEVAGITKDTPDPFGSVIERDPQTGDPIGVFQEDAGINLVLDHRPAYTAQELQRALYWAQERLNDYGITAIQDAIVKLDGNDAYNSLPTYRALYDKGDLTLRVVAALWWKWDQGLEQISALKKAREEFNHNRFSATSIKIWYDGVIETHTAALLESYADRPDQKGKLTIEPEMTKDVVAALDKEGFQVHFHAIGDAAIHYALNAFGAARTANGVRDSRHHISHVQLFDPADIPRFRELDVVANFQPLWAFADTYITELTLPRVGTERGRWIYPMQSLIRSGAVVAFGSDWYVTSANPLQGIETAITRLGPLGETTEVFIPEERMSLHDAIASYTIRSAYVNFLDDRTGSIEEGKLADIIVLDRNLFAIPAEDISEATVLLTLLDGQPVHGSLDNLRKTKTVIGAD